MAVVVSPSPTLSGELSLFHTTDPLLSNSPVLIFHGLATTIGATSSRIQVHIFTPAGYGSYARLAVSPNSPFYSAVSNLPREEQGDEVVRGLAFGLKKYFSELPDGMKKTWCNEAKAPSTSALFGDDHVAILASRMSMIENVDEVIGELKQAFGEQRLSWLDVDVVLPSGSIKQQLDRPTSGDSEDLDESQLLLQRYGRYAEVVASLGDVSFLPTSKLKRAPSKPTTIGRSPSFLRQQKESVRKELCELLNTEESYVERIKELNNLSSRLSGDLDGTTKQQLCDIIPTSIQNIIRLQSDFFTSIRTVFDATEKTAMADIEAMHEAQPSAQQARQDFVADTQGVGAIAKCLCDWFPKFSNDYREYMQTHAQSAMALRIAMKEKDSPLASYLQDIGEQKLTSLLIEPVQRLPRYNLYIDSIVKQLPIRHPAINPLLKARDVVTEICDHDDADTSRASTIEKFRSRVSAWPEGCQIKGRLVTAADFADLVPPYGLQGCETQQGMLVLFTDRVVFLEKSGNSATSAKTLMTEIENAPAPLRLAQSRPGTPQDLRFLRCVLLDSLDALEVQSGQALQILTSFEPDEAATSSLQAKVESLQVLRLDGQYERKAERLAEEITKARIEHRFSEVERESPKWEVRATDPMADTVSLFSAIFEDSNPDHTNSRSNNASVRVIVDIDRYSQKPRAGHDEIRTVASISPQRDGLWRLTIDSVNGNVSREHVTLSELVPVLRRKLTSLISSRFGIDHPAMTACLLARNVEVLQSINLQFRVEEDEELATPAKSTHRSKSPRKFLSNFLSSTGPGSQPPAFLKKDLPPLPPPGELSRASSHNNATQKPLSRESRPPSKDQPTPKSMSSMGSTELSNNALNNLEDTLSTFMLALQARKGNIVGRSLKMRRSADELAVNELYNSLLEDANMMVLAAQAPVDVLFAAFEKFLNIAWKEKIGQVLPYQTIQEIQAKAESLFPADFDAYFKSAISNLPPQNQRAFKGIMNLLVDLLDGTGNDGDRGILTAAFAELLVTEGNPHQFIALLDRFVDDLDTYFGEPLEEATKTGDGQTNPHKRARSGNSASISSNTSSLRKKFGLGSLSRENSKSEQESKVASVWRTLSKSTRGEASPANSISRGTLYRSYSTDVDMRGAPQRPSSQDEQSTLKSSVPGDDSFYSATSSTHNLGLSTIGEHPSFIPTGPPRKKRRSSLSDLKMLEVSQQTSPAWSPPAARRPPMAQRLEDKSLPNSPNQSTPSSKGGSGRFGSPVREPARSRLPSSFRKENSPGAAKAYGTTDQRPKSSGSKPDEVVITARPTSNIPTFSPKTSPQKSAQTSPGRSSLAERPDGGNIVKKPSPQPQKVNKPSNTTTTESGSPTKKLRMQSPQKLRERLQNEQSALSATQTSLQDELSKIGDELTSTPSRMGSIRTSTTPRSRGSATQSTNMELAQRMLKVEGQLPTQISDLNTRISNIQADLATSLTVSESKCKKLDELYREANGENEALYARFNDELGRILKAVKSGEGVVEMKKELKESQEEAAKLRRENGRLKRECAGLRAQMKE